jgi:hypothetical protein
MTKKSEWPEKASDTNHMATAKQAMAANNRRKSKVPGFRSTMAIVTRGRLRSRSQRPEVKG